MTVEFQDRGTSAGWQREVAEETIAARDWLHVIRLPAHAPALDPAEQGWSHVKRGWGNLIVCSIDQPVAVVKNRLKRIRCRPETAGEELHDRRPATM